MSGLPSGNIKIGLLSSFWTCSFNLENIEIIKLKQIT